MKNIHFIGICGAGMAGIAVMLKNEGYIVSGSNEGFYDPIASYLKRNGFELVPGYRPENIPADIGAQVYGLQDSCALGTGPFIFEGDEYPAANWDNRSKFEFYHPHHVLLTSGEHDHVNIFPTHQSFLERFGRLLQTLPSDSLTVGCIENDSVEKLLLNASHSITYGVNHGTWQAKNIQWGEETSFDVYKGEEFIVTATTKLLGRHNIQNCIGALALLVDTELLNAEAAAKGIRSFEGVQRRLDRIDKNGRTPIYEGFGSSYAKARSAIEAIALHYPNKKIYCIFEPHTFSWRDPAMSFWYKDVFNGVDNVAIVTPPASHGKDTAGQLNAEAIVEHIDTPLSSKKHFSEKETALSSIISVLEKNPDEYCVLILTSGEALQLGPALTAWSEQK